MGRTICRKCVCKAPVSAKRLWHSSVFLQIALSLGAGFATALPILAQGCTVHPWLFRWFWFSVFWLCCIFGGSCFSGRGGARLSALLARFWFRAAFWRFFRGRRSAFLSLVTCRIGSIIAYPWVVGILTRLAHYPQNQSVCRAQVALCFLCRPVLQPWARQQKEGLPCPSVVCHRCLCVTSLYRCLIACKAQSAINRYKPLCCISRSV